VGLLEDLGNESNFPKAKRAWCSICELIKDLPEKESEVFVARMLIKDITHSSLALVLKKNGYEISQSTVSRHRRGLCSGDAQR
jgi:hypothetical protein